MRMRPLAILLLASVLWGQDPDPKVAALAQQLVLAPDPAARELLIAGNPALVNHALVMAVSQLGDTYLDKRDFAQSDRVNTIVCDLAGRLRDISGLATCAYSRGMSLDQQDHPEEAAVRIEEARALWEQAGDHAWQSRALNELARIHALRSEYEDAEPLYRRAMEQAELSGELERVAQTSMNLGLTLRAQGRYREATVAIQRSIDLCVQLKLGRRSALPLLAMSGVYNYQRDWDLALKYGLDALKVVDQYQFNGIRASVYGNLGLAYQGLKRYDEARKYYEDELKIARDTNDEESRMMVLFNYGDLLREQNQPVAAQKNFEESLQLANARGRRAMAVHNRLSLAELATDAQRWSDAAALCSALAPDARAVSEPLPMIRMGEICGTSLLRLNRLTEAESALREGIEANESARRQLAGEQESAAIYMKDKESLYKRMVETLLAQGRTSDALRYAEMAKGRVVLDILQGTRAALNKSLSPEEQQRETALRSRVAVLSGELARVSSSNSARAAGIRASLENARQEQRSLLNTLYAAHPQLRLQRVDFETESPAGAVDASTAMLEYVVGDRAIYLFAITREETRVFTLAIAPDQAGRDVARFRQQIATRDLGYGVSARALYRTLLAPAAAALRGKSTLVIVPDGFLWQLPFQALQPAAGRHLLEKMSRCSIRRR